MSRIIEMIGKTFGRLTVSSRSENKVKPNGKQALMYNCLCSCGATTTVNGYSLRRGATKSCGCLNIEMVLERNTKHGARHHELYGLWCAMNSRCKKPSNPSFPNYGSRGIKVCERWGDFSLFLHDMGERPSLKHSIDRVDNNGGYEPNNCRWATRHIQNQNQRRNTVTPSIVRDVRISISKGDRNIDIAKKHGIHKDTISDIKRGKSWSNIT